MLLYFCYFKKKLVIFNPLPLFTEPLNRILCSSFQALMYTAEDGITVGPVLYADDNLTPLALDNAEQIQPILSLYDQYTGVSGLNINV